MVIVKGSYQYVHFVAREDHSKECKCKIAHACLQIGMHLLQEVEVDPQSQADFDLKQRSLQVLTEQQTAEEVT